MTVARIRARLFPDYGDGSPIWLPGRRLDWDDVKVTAQLKSRLGRLLSEELGWEVAYEE